MTRSLSLFRRGDPPSFSGIGETKDTLWGQAVSRETVAMPPSRAQRLRVAVLALYATGAELTADEAAQRLGEDFLAIRPRVSELHTEGLLAETGERRKGRRAAAHVYRVTPTGSEVLRELARRQGTA